MTLRLTEPAAHKPCPTCEGRGRVGCPETQSVRSGVGGVNASGAINTPGHGHPIPCPQCKGKKFVPNLPASQIEGKFFPASLR